MSHRALAVNSNWNANYDDWNFNANPVKNVNEWNAGNHVFSRYSSLSSLLYCGEVFFIISFLHPPTFFPIVSSSAPKEVNCSLDMSLFSQISWTKNFMSSILITAISNRGIFCFGFAKEALRRAVNRSKKALSTLFPSPNRSVRGIFLWIKIHEA